MQTQSACLTSFIVLSEAVTSLAWPVIFEFQRTKVVGNGLRNLRISHPRTRFSKCISVEWNHPLRDIWCWREKNISPFRTMTFLLSEGMLYSSFPLHCIFWAHILFDSCHFVIYMSVKINTGASWSSELCLEAFSSVYFVIFLFKLWFCRFLVLASVSGVSTSPESYFCSKQRETSCPLCYMKWLVVEFSLTKNGHNRDHGAISEFFATFGGLEELWRWFAHAV